MGLCDQFPIMLLRDDPNAETDFGAQPVGHNAFAVIRETIRNMNMVAIGRVVLPCRRSQG
jgi:hypothetical protein